MSEPAIRVIDIDGHVREADDLWERYLEQQGKPDLPLDRVVDSSIVEEVLRERR